ncbi:MAG: 16S rRNA (cytidine(1402)-2'-O)-methyltransferase [Nitrospiraceae bacterium]|nr:16S rRNA (cytidine(1402)-2'-O)-methyltransferase [Nitrospiraceae bacterium]
MRRERSQQNAQPAAQFRSGKSRRGTLYVICVPIGHPDDITLRGLRVLREVSLIASEDPASTQRLLNEHAIEGTVTSYGPRNIEEKVAVLIDRLLNGADVALVSDSGAPVIADPGHRLISAAHGHGIRVRSSPGASAVTAALSVSGFSGDSFFFSGVLPETRSVLKQQLPRLLIRREQTVAFCAVRSLTLILDLMKCLAPRRTIALACDLTKPNEMVIRGTAHQVLKVLAERPAIQDVTLILSSRTGRASGEKDDANDANKN